MIHVLYAVAVLALFIAWCLIRAARTARRKGPGRHRRPEG